MPARVNDSARATSADPRSRSHDANRDSRLGLFALLLALRIVNALTLRTFFQPDEFFQSLEPAWQLAYGQSSNAWITWVITLPPFALPSCYTAPTASSAPTEASPPPQPQSNPHTHTPPMHLP